MKPEIPRGAIVLGYLRDGSAVYLTIRDRSMHVFIAGGTGSGKSTLMRTMCFQDARARHGFTLIDPVGDLYDVLIEYLCYLRAIGYRPPDFIPFKPADRSWVLPYNPFTGVSGELSTLVDRRVDATLRIWGQSTGDETPRLAKWLKCLFTVLIQCNLTILEAAYLVDRHASEIRSFLLQGLTEPFIRAKLEQLSEYKQADFSAQMDSVESRLMRFLCSGIIRRTMGVGTSVLDFPAIMNEGKILLVNLGLGDSLSEEQQRLIGTLIISEEYEAAMRRPTGSRPHYLYIDEAGLFMTRELGKGFDQCRKKGLHITIAVQHPTQVMTDDPKLYKSITNNARNKFIFAMPDREDASVLADDLFPNLTAPTVKVVHKHLTHLIKDVRDNSRTESHTQTESRGSSLTEGEAHSFGVGSSSGVSQQSGESYQESTTDTRSDTTGESWDVAETESYGYSEQESHGWSDSQTSSYAHGRDTSTTLGRSQSLTRPRFGFFRATAADPLAMLGSTTEADSQSSSTSTSEAWGESTSDGYQESHATARSVAAGETRSWGSNRSKSHGLAEQYGRSTSRGVTKNAEESRTQSLSESQSRSRSSEQGTTTGWSSTEQPGTRHIPLWEETPTYWTLEERRWQAAELLMNQSIGCCHAKLVNGNDVFAVNIQAPKRFYIRPKDLLRFTRLCLEKYCLPCEVADRLILERQHKLLEAVQAHHNESTHISDGARNQRKKKDRVKDKDAGSLFDDVVGRE